MDQGLRAYNDWLSNCGVCLSANYSSETKSPAPAKSITAFSLPTLETKFRSHGLIASSIDTAVPVLFSS